MNTAALILGYVMLGLMLGFSLYVLWNLVVAPVVYVLCIYLFHWPGFIEGKPVTLRGIGRDVWRDYVDAIDYRASWLIVLRLKAAPKGRDQ